MKIIIEIHDEDAENMFDRLVSIISNEDNRDWLRVTKETRDNTKLILELQE